MTRIFLREHHAASACKKLCAAFRECTGLVSDLAEQAQGERVLVDAIEAATREVIHDAGSIDCGKFVRQEQTGIVMRKRLKVKQHRS